MGGPEFVERGVHGTESVVVMLTDFRSHLGIWERLEIPPSHGVGPVSITGQRFYRPGEGERTRQSRRCCYFVRDVKIKTEGALKHTCEKPARVLDYDTQTCVHRWKHNPTLRLDLPTQGDGT